MCARSSGKSLQIIKQEYKKLGKHAYNVLFTMLKVHLAKQMVMIISPAYVYIQ